MILNGFNIIEAAADDFFIISGFCRIPRRAVTLGKICAQNFVLAINKGHITSSSLSKQARAFLQFLFSDI